MAPAPDVEHLLNGVKCGDRHALEALIRSLAQPLFQYAARMVRDADAAEDIVQQTFIRVHKRRARLDAGGTLRGYCYRIASRLALNHIRDVSRRRKRESEAIVMQTATPPDPQAAALAREAWRLADDLPDDLRAVLHLRFGHGLSTAETAQALGLPEGTVSTRQRTGLQRLRERFALAVAVVPGVEPLGDAMCAEQPSSIAASPGFATRVEALVMASIGTYTFSKAAILTIAAILLAAGGITIAAIAWPANTPPPVVAHGGSEDTNANPPDFASGDQAETPEEPVAPSGTEQDEHLREPDQPEPAQTPWFIGKVTGRVVNSAGQPVAGAVVTAASLYEADPYFYAGDEYQVSGRATADTNGAFEMELRGTHAEGADRVLFRLSPSANGFVSNGSGTLWVEPGEPLAGIELRMFKPGRVEGVVVNASDGKTPVPDVRVTGDRLITVGSADARRAAPAESTTDEQGRFVLADLVPGMWYLNVRGRVLEFRLLPLPEDRPDAVEVKEGQAATGIVIQYSTRTLSFRTDPPVDELEGWFRFESILREGRITSSYTDHRVAEPDEDGVFRVFGAHSALKWMRLAAKDYGSGKIELNVTDAAQHDLGVIKLHRMPTLTGRVVDEDGNGIPHVQLDVQPADGGAAEEHFAGRDGRISATLPGPGDYQLTARRWGYSQAVTTVSVPETGTPSPFELTLTKTGIDVAGEVKIAGRAPENWQLGATGGESVAVKAYTAEAYAEIGTAFFTWPTSQTNPRPGGRFTLRDFKPGEYVLVAEFHGLRASMEVSVEEGKEQFVTLDLPAGGEIEGIVVGREGLPAAGTQVRLQKQAFGGSLVRGARATTDDEGRFRMRFVQPGSYYVRLSELDPDLMGPEQLQPRAVSVKDGEAVEFNINLSVNAGPVIHGKVTLNGEHAFSDVVLVTPNQALSFRSGTIDGEGRFEVSGMKPGSYYLWFADNKWKPRRFARIPVTVSADDRLEIRRDLRQCSLSGRVQVGDAGFDYTTASVQIRAEGDDVHGNDMAKGLAVFKTDSDAEGRFEVTGLVEGRYKLVATAPGHAVVERVIDLARDSVIDFFPDGRAGELQVKIAAVHGNEAAGPLPEAPMARLVWLRVLTADGADVALTEDQRALALEAGQLAVVPSLAPGAYRLLLTGARIERFSVEVTVRDGETTVLNAELHRAAEVRIRVLNTELSAETVRQARVEVFDSSGERVVVGDGFTSALDVDAEASASKVLNVSPLTAGVYRIVVTLTGYADHELNVQLARGQVLAREATLAR